MTEKRFLYDNRAGFVEMVVSKMVVDKDGNVTFHPPCKMKYPTYKKAIALLREKTREEVKTYTL